MQDLTPLKTATALATPAGLPSRPLDAVLRGSPDAFGSIYQGTRDRSDPLRIALAITQAEAFMASATAVHALLQEGATSEDTDEIRRQLKAFVAAWPNASGADLAGYGLQLLADVDERQPCRYAVREGLRHVRQTSRFLPSIAEVLIALDTAQARVRNAVWHIQQIPAEIEVARADLALCRSRETAGRARASDRGPGGAE